ncbi:MAG: hypothetical protein HEQ37_16700 [Acidovorax sp.]|jgi:ElaB/YqjD/DUF883 family membrane-anchored ribosome-binding protein|nr:hypothetical protein [Acidovorax sp.]
MNNDTLSNAATTGIRNLADDALKSAQETVQSTRQAAHSTLDKAEEGVHALRGKADPIIDDLAARAQDLASRSIDYCAETSAKARRQLHDAANATTRYVEQQPGKAVMIAAASGAALATLMFWMSRSRGRRAGTY